MRTLPALVYNLQNICLIILNFEISLYKVNFMRQTEEIKYLSSYGRNTTGFDNKSSKKMMLFLLQSLFRLFGIIQSTGILIKTWFTIRGLKAAKPKAYAMLKKMGKKPEKDMMNMIAMYVVLSDKIGKKAAYDFFKEIVQRTSPFQEEYYDLDELLQFEDVFEAFREYNYALFHNDPNFDISEFINEASAFHVTFTRCANVEITEAFGVPELGKLGCDHDITGYPAIQDRVNTVFHRPQTLAKGGTCCKFHFYKKGTEPKGSYQNK